jgi:hypothetical protein
MKKTTLVDALIGVPLVIAVVTIIFGLGAIYGSIVHDNWKCGMPGAHCVITLEKCR